VEERSGESEDRGFLPPEPAGPEPELGGRPPQQPQAPPQQPQQPQPPPQQPPPQAPQQQQQTYGYPPPPPGYGYPPPPPPPGYGYQAPPGYGQPAPWGYQPAVPDNGQAVAGFVFSLVSLGLLVISAGLSTIVSIGCAIAGIICGRNGKRKVDAGETPKHRGLAQAGYIIGWVSLALSILATIAWIIILIVAINDPSSFDDSQTVRAGARFIGV
jgi:hypothetical protein